jgi:signal transduction histidine kinase
MTYPLRVGGRLLGVLLGGQIVVKDANVSWGECLKAEHVTVRWDTFDPRSGNQIADICSVLEQEVQQPLKSELEGILREDQDGKNTDVPTLRDRWDRFCRFGRMMESLLTQLYARTVSGAQDRILSQIGDALLPGTARQDAWWWAVAGVTRALDAVADVNQVDIYSRAGPRYVQQVCAGELVELSAARRVPVKICVSIPTEELTPIQDLSCASEAREAFGIPEGGYIYKCDYKGLESRSISTILLLRGNLGSEEIRKFVADFCHVVGLRADMRELLFQIDADRRSFADQARRAAHASRTPLQIALSDIELAELRGASGDDPDYAALMERVKDRISDSESEISEILARVPRPRRILDIREIAKRLAEEMKPLAEHQKCKIAVDLPTFEVLCRVSEPEIRIALRHLLDNAIKYSFRDHTVWVRMSVVHASAVIVFDNFGVGIPEKKLRAIREIGERGEVVDRRRERRGFGVGLSIAIHDVEAHGGSLDIESYRADPDPRGPSLRFATRVTVTLPLA